MWEILRKDSGYFSRKADYARNEHFRNNGWENLENGWRELIAFVQNRLVIRKHTHRNSD